MIFILGFIILALVIAMLLMLSLLYDIKDQRNAWINECKLNARHKRKVYKDLCYLLTDNYKDWEFEKRHGRIYPIYRKSYISVGAGLEEDRGEGNYGMNKREVREIIINYYRQTIEHKKLKT